MNKLTVNLDAGQRQELLVKQLDKQKRSTLTDFQMGKLKSWADFTRLAGVVVPVDIANQTLNYSNVKLVFDKQIELAKSGQLKLELPKEKIASDSHPKPSSDEIKQEASDKRETIDDFSSVDCLKNNPLVIYNKHQEKATAELVRNFMLKGYFGQALSCRVGGGKTYILGAMIRELWERQWPPIMESVAQYPILYITRASVVEQTERVLYNQFKLRPAHQVSVTNIDKIRSSYGERFIKSDLKVISGIEHWEYRWLPFLSPALIVLDECQSVKNIDSTQSEMMQAYNDLAESHLVCSSATLFTRVIESKLMAVSTRMEW